MLAGVAYKKMARGYTKGAWKLGAGSCDRREALDFDDVAQKDVAWREEETMTPEIPAHAWLLLRFAWLGIWQALSCCIHRRACWG
jgi:hypothetical protein